MPVPRRALALLLVVAGCRGDPTSLMVTVNFDDSRYAPERLDVTVEIGGSTLRMNTPVAAPGARAVRDGDSFLVLVPDRYDGMLATVNVIAVEGTQPTLAAGGSAKVRLHQVTGLSIRLDGNNDKDGGTGDMQPTCFEPLNISAGGMFSGNSLGARGMARGTCGGDGVEIVAETTLTEWSNLELDTTGSAYDTVLYTRSNCLTDSELPLGGLCTGGLATGSACNDDALLPNGPAKLVLCGLPPGNYWTYLDAKVLGGPWQLAVTRTTADLNSCEGAGNLLRGGMFTVDMDAMPHTDQFNSTFASCGSNAGKNSADAVFFLTTTTATKSLSFHSATTGRAILYVRPGCAGADIQCNSGNRNQSVMLTNPPAGTYFVIVDGDPSLTGKVTVTATVTN